MAFTSSSGAGREGQPPWPPDNMPPEPSQQTEDEGERPKLSFKSAALKLVQAASAFWMMKRGAPAPPPVLTLDEKEQIQQAFEMLDEDGSGNVGIDEMITAYAMVGIHLTKAAALELVAEVDADGSGEIEFDEFRSLMGRALRPDAATGTKAAGSGQQPVLKITDMVMALRRKKMLQALEQGGPARAKMVQQADQMIAATQAQARRQKMSTAGGGMAVVRNLMARLSNAQAGGGSGDNSSGGGSSDSTSAAAGPPKMGIMGLIAAAKKARIAEDAAAAEGSSNSQQQMVGTMAWTDVRLSPAVAAAALGVAVAYLAAAAAGPPSYQIQTALCSRGRLPVSTAAATAEPAVAAGTTFATQGDTQRPRSPSPEAHAAQRQQQHLAAGQQTATCAGSCSSSKGQVCQASGAMASPSAAAPGQLGRCLLQQQAAYEHQQQPSSCREHLLGTAYTSKIRQGARPADLISTAASSSSSSSPGAQSPDDAARKPQLISTLKALQQRVPHAKLRRVMGELEHRDCCPQVATRGKGMPGGQF